MNIKLRMTASVALRLETAVKETRGLEFSGLGFCKQERGGIVIYDVVVMHVGSEAYTEIDPKSVIDLMEREDNENMHVWFHRHPVGNGIPGRHCWSGMDENTIQTNPLGGIPELVKWSISIVRTPGGWVGRLDDHINKTTMHIPLHPQLPMDYIQCIRDMTPKQFTAYPMPNEKKKPILLRPLARKNREVTEKVYSDAFGDDYWTEQRWYEEDYDTDTELEFQLSLWEPDNDDERIPGEH